MSAPSCLSAERTSADAANGTPIGATVLRVLLPDDLTADADDLTAAAAGRHGQQARADARAAIGEAIGDYLDAALTAGTLRL